MGKKVYWCFSEEAEGFLSSACQTVFCKGELGEEGKKRKTRNEKIKHDQTEAATKQIYAFGATHKSQSGKNSEESERKCVQKGSAGKSAKLREINKEIMLNFRRRSKGQSNSTSCA